MPMNNDHFHTRDESAVIVEGIENLKQQLGAALGENKKLKQRNDELETENENLKCELGLWRDGNIIREETLDEINSISRALYRLRIGFALHSGRVNSGKMIIAYWKTKYDKLRKEAK